MKEPLRDNYDCDDLLAIRQEISLAKMAVDHGFSGNERWRDKVSYEKRLLGLTKLKQSLEKQANERYIKDLHKYAEWLQEQEREQEELIEEMEANIEKLKSAMGDIKVD